MLRGIEKLITYLIMIVIVVFAFVFLVKQLGMTTDLKESMVQAKRAGFALGDLDKITQLHQSSARVFFLSFFSFFLLLIGLVIIIRGIERAYDISEVKEKVRHHLKSTTPGVVMVVLASFLLVFSIYRSSNLEASYSSKLVDFNNYKIAMEGFKYPDNTTVRIDSSVMPRLKNVKNSGVKELKKDDKQLTLDKAKKAENDKISKVPAKTEVAAKPEARKVETVPVKPSAPKIATTKKVQVVPSGTPANFSYLPAFAQDFIAASSARNLVAIQQKPKEDKKSIAKNTKERSERSPEKGRAQLPVAKNVKPIIPAKKPAGPDKSIAKNDKPVAQSPVKAVVHAKKDRPSLSSDKDKVAAKVEPAKQPKPAATPKTKEIVKAKTEVKKDKSLPVAKTKQEVKKEKPLAIAKPKPEVKKSKEVASARPKVATKKAESIATIKSRPEPPKEKATNRTKHKEHIAAKPTSKKAKFVETQYKKPAETQDVASFDNRPVTNEDIEWARKFQKRVIIYGYTPTKLEKHRYRNVYQQTDGRAVSSELHWAYSFLEKTKRGYEPKPGEMSQYENIIERNVSGASNHGSRNSYH